MDTRLGALNLKVPKLRQGGISKSSVSKLRKDIVERLNEFLNRPLTGEWPCVWLAATCLKRRQAGRIFSLAANTDGRREIIAPARAGRPKPGPSGWASCAV